MPSSNGEMRFKHSCNPFSISYNSSSNATSSAVMALDCQDSSNQNLCAFCGGSSGDAPLVVDQHRIISRENTFIVVGMRCETHYNAITIEVPRCRRCQQSHRLFALTLQIPAIAILVLALVLGMSLLWQFWKAGELTIAVALGLVASMVTGVLIVFAAFGLLHAVFEFIVDSLGFNTERRARSVEPVKSLLAAGWAVGAKPPYKGDNVVHDNTTS
jgi:hypothetical protein